MVLSPAFAETGKFFHGSLADLRSLISADSAALLYALVRNLCPAHVIEIGTYRAGTAEVICRALAANGRGSLYTTDPYRAMEIEPILRQWPPDLRRHLQFSAMNSMEFFSEIIERGKIRSAMTFVDGNHDYEFALFDILSAARSLEPGGFLIIDNVSHSGPYFAARDFLERHPDWLECRVSDRAPDMTKAFDPRRTNIDGTDFIVLRAPAHFAAVTDRPISFGLLDLDTTGCDGVTVTIGEVGHEGSLHAQCVLRGFSSTREGVERSSNACLSVSPRDSGTRIQLPAAIDIGPGFDVVRLEIWLIWTGPTPLLLSEVPVPFHNGNLTEGARLDGAPD
jgi:predicted O-methyltransferase YrrM